MAVDSIGNILGMLSGREGILVCDLDDRAWSLRHKFSTRAVSYTHLLGQLDMVWENADASIDRAETLIKQAAKAAAECIIFPEMSFTGVTLNTAKVAEDPKDSRTVQRMKELAKSYNLAIGFGWAASPEGEEKLVTNRFTLLDKEGTVVGEYKKMHPFTYGGESDCYAKGNEIVTVPFLGRKIALFICYDLRFPEIFQIAAREADVLLVIANWPQIRRCV